MKRQKPPTPMRFCSIWQRAHTIQEVMRKTGLSRPACSNRAVYYRARGVPLKKFLSGRPRCDVGKLMSVVRRSEGLVSS